MGTLPKIESLSLRQLIGQMIVVRTSGYLADDDRAYPQWEADQQTLQTWIQEKSVGGVILLGGSTAEVSFKTKQLQNWANIPLLIAADIEEGVGQRFPGATWFPPPMALAEIYRKNPKEAIALAEQMGEVIAKEALSIGINWVLAPVMDVNNNPQNPVINVRAFGETPEEVSALGSAFIRGSKKHPALTTAKHFPGHGDTAMDSHVSLPTIPHNIERLEQIELPPFQKVIASGVDTVMTAHLTIPAFDQSRPATLSPQILTGLLRKQLNFQGLIVTDALMMGGVTTFAKPEEVAVMAVEAGADILLMPPDVDGVIAAIETAIETGRLAIERLRDSVKRIWAAKEKLATEKTYSFPSGIDRQQSKTIVESILTESNKYQKSDKLIPSFTDEPAQNLIVVDSITKSDFLSPNCPAIAIPQSHGYQPQVVELKHFQKLQLDNEPTIIQFFTRGNPFAGMLANPNNLLKVVSQTTNIFAILNYGTPYNFAKISQSHQQQPCMFSYGQMAIAQELLCSRLWQISTKALRGNKEFT